MLRSCCVSSHKKSNTESYIIYKKIILYLQIGMFSKDISSYCKFVFNTHQIYSLDLFLYRLPNTYLNSKSWGTCKFLKWIRKGTILYTIIIIITVLSKSTFCSTLSVLWFCTKAPLWLYSEQHLEHPEREAWWEGEGQGRMGLGVSGSSLCCWKCATVRHGIKCPFPDHSHYYM